MKGTRIELSDEMMNDVNGGLTFDSANKTLGYSSSTEKPYHYDNEALVGAYVTIHCRDKTWTSGKECDAYLIEGLLAEGLIWTE